MNWILWMAPAPLLGALAGNDTGLAGVISFTLLGFVVVMIALGFLTLAMNLNGMIFKRQAADPEAAPPAANLASGVAASTSPAVAVSPEHRLVITAAVAAVFDDPVHIRDIRPVEDRK